MKEKLTSKTNEEIINKELIHKIAEQGIKGESENGGRQLTKEDKRSFSFKDRVSALTSKIKEMLPNKKDALLKSVNAKINTWTSKGLVSRPTAEEMAKFISDAEADGYEGVLGLTEDKKIFYKTSKEVKWGTTSHSVAG